MDAKAPYAEEGRGKLRKATGSRKQALIRRYPNGETRRRTTPSPANEYIVCVEGTRGTETSQYPEEEKETSIFQVAASERERGQTRELAFWGCGPAYSTRDDSGRGMESPARAGNSPVGESVRRRAGTRVPQDTRNPAGSREDHLPSLNTIW